MEFHEIIKAAALEYARANAIVMPGDVVYTTWGGAWQKLHKVQICGVGAALAEHHPVPYEEFNSALFVPLLEMTYYACRLRADGTRKFKGSAIVLTEFTTEEGVEWHRTHIPLNKYAFHWELPESWPYDHDLKDYVVPNEHSELPEVRR